MTGTDSITVEEIITTFATRLAAALGEDLSDTERSVEGFPAFLAGAATRITDYTASALDEAADQLLALRHLDPDSKRAQKLLAKIHDTLLDVAMDLEML